MLFDMFSQVSTDGHRVICLKRVLGSLLVVSGIICVYIPSIDDAAAQWQFGVGAGLLGVTEFDNLSTRKGKK